MQTSIITIRGIFQGNELLDLDTGEHYFCMAYGILRKQMEGVECFFNISYDKWGNMIIFQCVKID